MYYVAKTDISLGALTMDFQSESTSAPTKPSDLQEVNKKKLHDLEALIRLSLYRFIEIGRELGEVLQDRLFETLYPTFEQYCQQRLGMSRSQAYRLISAYRVYKNLSVNLNNVLLPDNERQLRGLTQFTPDEQVQVWLLALEISGGERPTGNQVELAAVQFKNKDGPVDRTPSDESQIASSVQGFEIKPSQDKLEGNEPVSLFSIGGQIENPRTCLEEPLSDAGNTINAIPNPFVLKEESNFSMKRAFTCNPVRNSPVRIQAPVDPSSFNRVPKHHRDDKAGYWKQQALKWESECEHLKQKIEHFKSENLRVENKLRVLSERLKTLCPTTFRSLSSCV